MLSQRVLFVCTDFNLMNQRPSIIASASISAAFDSTLTKKEIDLRVSLISSCGNLESVSSITSRNWREKRRIYNNHLHHRLIVSLWFYKVEFQFFLDFLGMFWWRSMKMMKRRGRRRRKEKRIKCWWFTLRYYKLAWSNGSFLKLMERD